MLTAAGCGLRAFTTCSQCSCSRFQWADLRLPVIQPQVIVLRLIPAAGSPVGGLLTRTVAQALQPEHGCSRSVGSVETQCETSLLGGGVKQVSQASASAQVSNTSIC